MNTTILKKMPRFPSKLTTKKQVKATFCKETKKSINADMTQTLELSDKELKIITINMIRDLGER